MGPRVAARRATAPAANSNGPPAALWVPSAAPLPFSGQCPRSSRGKWDHRQHPHPWRSLSHDLSLSARFFSRAATGRCRQPPAGADQPRLGARLRSRLPQREAEPSANGGRAREPPPVRAGEQQLHGSNASHGRCRGGAGCGDCASGGGVHVGQRALDSASVVHQQLRLQHSKQCGEGHDPTHQRRAGGRAGRGGLPRPRFRFDAVLVHGEGAPGRPALPHGEPPRLPARLLTPATQSAPNCCSACAYAPKPGLPLWQQHCVSLLSRYSFLFKPPLFSPFIPSPSVQPLPDPRPPPQVHHLPPGRCRHRLRLRHFGLRARDGDVRRHSARAHEGRRA